MSFAACRRGGGAEDRMSYPSVDNSVNKAVIDFLFAANMQLGEIASARTNRREVRKLNPVGIKDTPEPESERQGRM